MGDEISCCGHAHGRFRDDPRARQLGLPILRWAFRLHKRTRLGKYTCTETASHQQTGSLTQRYRRRLRCNRDVDCHKVSVLRPDTPTNEFFVKLTEAEEAELKGTAHAQERATRTGMASRAVGCHLDRLPQKSVKANDVKSEYCTAQ
jgi:hypothetical protein